jgi:7,8-dihydropterin-6-yl-methyl-4-(beta-D-ribofuranosyl)aminobenzene 5'-phosphate synthase
MNEISLLINTPKGGGAGRRMLPSRHRKDLGGGRTDPTEDPWRFGGFHLVDMSDAGVTDMVMRFRDKWKIERMAAGHCTGQFALQS